MKILLRFFITLIMVMFNFYIVIESVSHKQSCNLPNMAGKQPEETCQLKNFLKSMRITGEPMHGHNVLLFTGKSGAGKTMGAQQIASSSEAIFYQYSADLIEEKDPSGGAGYIKNIIFKKAQEDIENGNVPVVILIDNLNAVFDQTSKDHASFLYELNHQLQKNFDNPKLLVILTARDTQTLPKSLLNRCIEVHWELPDREGRSEIFRYYLKLFPNRISEKFLKNIANQTNRFSAEDIRFSILHARSYAKMENSFCIREDHIRQAILEMRATVNEKNPSVFQECVAYTAKMGGASITAYKTYQYIRSFRNKGKDKKTNEKNSEEGDDEKNDSKA